jgi:DNA-binding CsgD family transcriptional regulator
MTQANPFGALLDPLLRRPGDPTPPTLEATTRGRYGNTRKASLTLPDVPNPWGLSRMQCYVFRRLVAGVDQTEAARELAVSKKTVAEHVARARGKMGGVTTVQGMLLWDRFERKAA